MLNRFNGSVEEAVSWLEGYRDCEAATWGDYDALTEICELLEILEEKAIQNLTK